MSAFNPTAQEIEERVKSTPFGRGLSADQRETFVRDMLRVAEKMPSPSKAAAIGAGIGTAVALVAGRSVLKYGALFAVLSYVSMAALDVTFTGGYAMGFGAASGKRTT